MLSTLRYSAKYVKVRYNSNVLINIYMPTKNKAVSCYLPNDLVDWLNGYCADKPNLTDSNKSPKLGTAIVEILNNVKNKSIDSKTVVSQDELVSIDSIQTNDAIDPQYSVSLLREELNQLHEANKDRDKQIQQAIKTVDILSRCMRRDLGDVEDYLNEEELNLLFHRFESMNLQPGALAPPLTYRIARLEDLTERLSVREVRRTEREAQQDAARSNRKSGKGFG